MSSKKTIGAGIAIDGEKEFKQAISSINSDLSVLKSEMKKVTSEFIDNENSMESLVAKQEVYNKQIASQTEKVDTLKSALENAKKEYGENSKQVQSWQIKLNNAEADLNKMNKELADIKKQASGIDKVEDAFDDLGESVGNAFSTIGKIGGAAIGGAVTAASGLITGFLNLSETGKELDAQTGKLCIAFEKVGMSEGDAYTTTQELYGVLGDTDKATEAAMLLAKMSDTEDDLAENSRILTGVLAEYGESIPIEGLAEGMQATAAMGSVQGVLADALEWQGVNLDDYNEKLSTLSDSEERAAYIQQTLTEIYGESADEYKLINNELIDANQAQYEFEETLGAIGKTAIPVTTTLKSFANGLMSDVFPGIEQFAFGLNGLLNGEEDAAADIGESVSSVLDAVVGEIDVVLPILTDAITAVAPAVLTSLITGLTDNSEMLLSCAFDIIIELAESLLTLLPEIVSVGLELICSLALGIADSIPELMPTIISVIDEIVSVLSDPENLSSLLEAALEIIAELGYSLIDAIPQLVDSVFEIIKNITVFLTDPENLALIINTALDLIIALGTGLINAIPELITSVLEISASIWDSLLETDWGEVGTNIVDGLLEGLKTAWESLKTWFTDSFESLKTSVKDLFDIHSPSRWAKDEIMGNVMKGFGLGIEENADEVKKQMDSFTATFTDDVEYDLNIRSMSARIAASEPPADILAVTHSQATGSTGDKFDKMLALLEIIAMNSKKDILLDKDTIVGELAPEINSELGEIYAMKERGN